jgi:hypothetical protein
MCNGTTNSSDGRVLLALRRLHATFRRKHVRRQFACSPNCRAEQGMYRLLGEIRYIVGIEEIRPSPAEVPNRFSTARAAMAFVCGRNGKKRMRAKDAYRWLRDNENNYYHEARPLPPSSATWARYLRAAPMIQKKRSPPTSAT